MLNPKRIKMWLCCGLGWLNSVPVILSRPADFPLKHAGALVGISKAHLCPKRMLSHRCEGPLGLLYGVSKPKTQPIGLLPKNVWVEAEKLGKMGHVHAGFYPRKSIFLAHG